MSVASIATPPERTARWRADLGIALLATLATLAIHAGGGFSTLANPAGDNDALMRLVQVRDLIAGQDWFDLTQYRMGPEGGFPMHWSRLVDAPIAGLVLAGTALAGDQALGEAIASVLWPQILFAAAVALILRAGRSLGGERALLPAAVVGAVTLHTSGLFAPGALDHHTLQLVLALALANFLLAEADDRVAAYGAGSSAALMLAIGMETLPYVAAGGLCVAALFLLRGHPEAGRAGRFGATLGVVSLSIFVLTVPQSAWMAPQCDAFSIAQTALAAAAGFGLWGIVKLARTQAIASTRAVWLAALGAVVGAAAIMGFPQCLGDPFPDLDPRLRTYWLDGVQEAQSVADFLAQDPVQIAAYYATPLLGLILLGVKARKGTIRRTDVIVGAFLAGAFAVSLWQVRGSMFSLPLAVIPLAAWISERRERAQNEPSPAETVTLLAAWLLSFHFVWYTAASAAQDLLIPPAAAEEAQQSCYRATDYALLAAQPPSAVVAVSNLGASILAYTGHRAFAGSYHRNVEGNLMTLDILMGPLDQAKRRLQAAGAGFVVSCPGNNESKNLALWAPAGLEAALRRDDPPGWLEQLPESKGAALRIYRITP